jgi:thymidylate kinase
MAFSIGRVIEALQTNNEYALIERGIYDRLAFIECYRTLGLIDNGQADIRRNYIQEFTGSISFPVLFSITPDDSIARTKEKNYIADHPRKNKRFLEALYIAYQAIAQDPRVVSIDATKSAEQVFESVEKLLSL